jgi:hypothetical protein
MTHTTTTSFETNTSYTEIFLLAAECVALKSKNKKIDQCHQDAFDCFYKDGKRLLSNPLKPTAMEKAYVVNKFAKKSNDKQKSLAMLRSDSQSDSRAMSF